MRTARIALAVPGAAAVVWGLVLAVRFALHSFADGRSAAEFLVGAPVLHDAVVAPIVGVVGWVISTRVGAAWRTPVRVGAAMSAVLTLLAVPALWRANAGQPNPGLDDRNYGLGLLVALVVVWLLALAGGLVRRHRLTRSQRPSSGGPSARSASP